MDDKIKDARAKLAARFGKVTSQLSHMAPAHHF